MADGASTPLTPSAQAYAPPERADRGLLIVHGAGDHDPITSLDEILNPTLNRLRYEGNLVSAQRFSVGDPAQPGGKYDGLLVEYVQPGKARCDRDDRVRYRSEPLMPGPFLESTKDSQRLLVIEGRWDRSFLDPGYKDVSSWAGHHVGRMMFELFLYHLRSPIDVIASTIIIALFVLGGLNAGDDWTIFWILMLMGVVSGLAALIDAFSSWWERKDVDQLVCEPAELTPATNWFWYAVIPAVTMSVYNVQRSFVLVVSFAATILLTLLAPLVRVLSTIPGLNWASRNFLSLFESFALTGAPTDVQSISSNPVASAAIQTRLRGALAEVESRLENDAEITVLGHSAAAPLAFWLLSEPGIHIRQQTKPLKYRLITVGGALNWAKRGMDCEATPLDRPLVHSDRPAGEKTYWLDCHSTWDPTPHGPVRRIEYEGSWQTWTQRQPVPPERRRRRGWLRRVLYNLRADFWRHRFDDRPMLVAGAEPPHATRPDPNMLVRNLGSPISAEHSEYFRNQQEFVPALVRSIDAGIQWAQTETQPARKNQWENARLALLSCLVRARMAVFIVPIAALVSALSSNKYLITSCKPTDENLAVSDFRSANAWPLLDWIGDRMSLGFKNLPVVGDQREGVCNFVVLEQLAVVVVIALICYALVDVYTNFCWATLGRRLEPLDSPAEAAGDAKRPFLALLRAPTRWRWWRIPVRPMLIVWLPTLIPPLLFWFAFPIVDYWATWWLLVAVNIAMMPLEIAWFSRCLRRAPEAGIAYGRALDALDIGQLPILEGLQDEADGNR